MTESKKIGVTEVVLRDAHQSLLATRFRYHDMEAALKNLDDVGFWSVESWGGAIFDSCIRYLGEDPWERIRKIKYLTDYILSMFEKIIYIGKYGI